MFKNQKLTNPEHALPFVSKEREIERHKRQLRKLSSTAEPGERFESEFGLFMSHLKPIELSKKPFKVTLKDGDKYDIDVFAEFPEVIVITECKEGETHKIPTDLSRVSDNMGRVSNVIRGLIPDTKGKNFIFILAYCNQIPPDTMFSKARSSGIVLLDRKMFGSYFNLADKLRASARDIIFSDWLKEKQIKGLPSNEKIIPAIRGKFEGLECYNFMVSPYLLKKFCYVHRRHIQHTLSEENISYQRLIKPSKIKGIKKFLEKGNFFPSSVLINFDEGIEFFPIKERPSEMKGANPNINQGWIKPKKKHGCAMVIDGQHRIFGYSGLDETSKEHSLNVIAFSKLADETQANLFAQINENQTSINKDVLWDLYEDILPEESPKYKISRIAKKLNKQSKKDFFKDKIFIPSISRRARQYYPLNMNSVCRPLSSRSDIYKKISDYDETLYYSIVDNFFSHFLTDKSLEKEWKRGKNGLLLSNNGFEILTLVFNYFLEFLLKKGVDYKNISSKELSSHLKEFSSIIVKSIKSIGVEKLRKYIPSSSGGARKKASNEIIIEAGNHSLVFKKISNRVYLQNIKEDMNNELKSTLYFDKNKGDYCDDYFRDAILGTLVAFINAGVDGNLYIGVSDDGKKEGLDYELKERFKDDVDEMIKFIESKIETEIMTKDYFKHSIRIDVFQENPLLLKIHVKESNEGIAIVSCKNGKGSKKHHVWIKTSSGKRRIKNIKQTLGEHKGNKLNALIAEYYQP